MNQFFLISLFLTASTRVEQPWNQFGGPTRDFRVAELTESPGGIVWKREFGSGKSGIVSDGTYLFTTFSRPTDDKKVAKEITTALDPKTGKTVWESEITVKQVGKQETYGGDPVQPLATPTVVDGRVYSLGYSGMLRCLDVKNGNVVWSADLVADFGANPVQYGFSSSPIVFQGRLIAHVGGEHALIACDLKTGLPVWKSESAAPSYATPVIVTLGSRTVIAQVTRDRLLFIDPNDGKTVGDIPMSKKGFTNVPTPISLPGNRLLVAGQGWEGTRLFQLEEKDGKVTATERWHQRRIQYFYTNWIADGELAVGYPGNSGGRFTALNLKDGSIAFQELSQTDASVIAVGSKWLLVRGDGLLSWGTFGPEGFLAERRAMATTGRCWVPPTILNDGILVRSDRELAYVKLSALKSDYIAPADSGVSALNALYGGKK